VRIGFSFSSLSCPSGIPRLLFIGPNGPATPNVPARTRKYYGFRAIEQFCRLQGETPGGFEKTPTRGAPTRCSKINGVHLFGASRSPPAWGFSKVRSPVAAGGLMLPVEENDGGAGFVYRSRPFRFAGLRGGAPLFGVPVVSFGHSTPLEARRPVGLASLALGLEPKGGRVLQRAQSSYRRKPVSSSHRHSVVRTAAGYWIPRSSRGMTREKDRYDEQQQAPPTSSCPAGRCSARRARRRAAG
jgi:hypothetical protein